MNGSIIIALIDVSVAVLTRSRCRRRRLEPARLLPGPRREQQLTQGALEATRMSVE